MLFAMILVNKLERVSYFLQKDESQGDDIKNDDVSKSKCYQHLNQAEEIACVKKRKDMEIKECICSLQVCVKRYLNDKSDMDQYSQNI